MDDNDDDEVVFLGTRKTITNNEGCVFHSPLGKRTIGENIWCRHLSKVP